MRFLLVGLLALHGLIHLMGFAKAFDLARIDALKAPIGRGAGVLWLLAALLLVAAAALVLGRVEAWWVPALAGVALSQALILSAWGDAKFGTVANVLLLVPLVVAVKLALPSSHAHQYQRAAEQALRVAAPTPVVTEGDLAGLPPVVQRWLGRVGVVGRPRVQNFRARWNARLRSAPTASWMEMPAVQVNTVAPPGRVFLMKGSMYGLPVEALHEYRDAQATMRVMLAGFVEVADARGETMSRSETVTVLNDVCLLAPSALLEPRFAFTDATEREVTVTFTNGPHQVSARLFFDEAGDLVDFRSGDRFKSLDGKTYENFPWSTPLRGHREVGGLRLPGAGEAVWHEPTGAWTYIEFELEDVAYNVAPSATAERSAPVARSLPATP